MDRNDRDEMTRWREINNLLEKWRQIDKNHPSYTEGEERYARKVLAMRLIDQRNYPFLRDLISRVMHTPGFNTRDVRLPETMERMLLFADQYGMEVLNERGTLDDEKELRTRAFKILSLLDGQGTPYFKELVDAEDQVARGLRSSFAGSAFNRMDPLVAEGETVDMALDDELLDTTTEEERRLTSTPEIEGESLADELNRADPTFDPGSTIRPPPSERDILLKRFRDTLKTPQTAPEKKKGRFADDEDEELSEYTLEEEEVEKQEEPGEDTGEEEPVIPPSPFGETIIESPPSSNPYRIPSKLKEDTAPAVFKPGFAKVLRKEDNEKRARMARLKALMEARRRRAEKESPPPPYALPEDEETDKFAESIRSAIGGDISMISGNVIKFNLRLSSHTVLWINLSPHRGVKESHPYFIHSHLIIK